MLKLGAECIIFTSKLDLNPISSGKMGKCNRLFSYFLFVWIGRSRILVFNDTFIKHLKAALIVLK